MSENERDPQIEALLEFIKRSRGFDFTGYKRSSLMRRVLKRMQSVGIPDFTDYLEYLELHPEEFSQLFNGILINVTDFFRDLPAWEYLSREIIPRLLAGRPPDSPIRVWSAGCASGEEAYTLAIILTEAFGVEQFRERVKIYATDVDEEALMYARHASYSARDVSGVPEVLREKYFEHTDSRFLFQRDLRRNVIFGRNDLLQDAPISRIDLLVCRNTLMYFHAEAQARILSRLHFALSDEGFIFLGKAEMLFSHSDLFLARDLKMRIFSKVLRPSPRDYLLPPGRSSGNGGDEGIAGPIRQSRIREAVFEAGSVAQVVIDVNGTLALVNEQARLLFHLNKGDLGRPFQDLELSYHPAEVRTALARVRAERHPISIKDIRWLTTNGEVRYLDVMLMPLLETGGALLGISIIFSDTTPYKQLQAELEETNRELETAYEELQSTNEELETTNEELETMNEELETTNEELHSTNEELETMNEELQSANEELETMNEELRQRGLELNHVNSYMTSILTSLHGGVAVLDRNMEVQIWSSQAEDLWGLRADEALGRHFLNLDIGLPVELLRQPIRACLAGANNYCETTMEAINRRGKPVSCQVTCTPQLDAGNEISGVILVMEEMPAVSVANGNAPGGY